MAKKVILKDLNNIEILPITRGELILDSSGKEAFHSSDFLATQSLPGLMSATDKYKIDNLESVTLSEYLKSVTVTDNKLTLIKQDNTLINFYDNYRPISINGISILENNNTALNLVAGTNISLNAEKDASNNYTGKVLVTASDSKVTQTIDDTTDSEYSILFSETDDDVTHTEGSRKSSKLKYNPSKNYLSSGLFVALDFILNNSSIKTILDTLQSEINSVASKTNFKYLITEQLDSDVISSEYLYTNNFISDSITANSVNTLLVNSSGILTLNATNSIYLKYANNDAKSVVLNGTEFKPFDTANGLIDLGASDARWKNIYGITGDFSNIALKGNSLAEILDTLQAEINSISNKTNYKYLVSEQLDSNVISSNYIYADNIESVNFTTTTLQATTLQGYLDGFYVNKLTGYNKATSAADLTATDTLNIALGKLEYKADITYDWYKSITLDDTDNIINKWGEIVDFIDSVAEGTDIIDEFVTRKTALTITGVKTFSSLQKFTVAQGTAPFTVTSTTAVPNLNADLLDGFHESTFFRGRGNVSTDYVDIDVYTSGDSRFQKMNPGIYLLLRTNYTELFISLALNYGSTSSLELKTLYSNNEPIYVRKIIDANRVSGPWKALAFTDSNITGNAATATVASRLSTDAGSLKEPVYFSGGIPKVCTYIHAKRKYSLDLSSLSIDNFYPVTFDSDSVETDCEIHSPALSASAAYNLNVIHFLYNWLGWMDTPKRFIILHYGVHTSSEITIGAIGGGDENGKLCVWLRGGMQYRFYSNKQPHLQTLDYTNGNEIFTVGTNYYGGTNTKVTISWQAGDNASNKLVATLEYASNIYVGQNNSTTGEFSLIWSNVLSTESKSSSQLRKSYSDLVYNPANKRLTVKGSITTPYFYYNLTTASTKPIIHIGSSNLDTTLFRVYSSELEENSNYLGRYGYSLKYIGTDTGDDNYLVLYSDNQTAETQNIAIAFDLTGRVGIRQTPTASYALSVSGGIWSSAGFIKSGSSNSYLLLGGGGHKAISDFMLKSEELINNVTTITKELTVTAAWMDTGIAYNNIPANGTYIVLVSVTANDSTGNMWYGYWSGVMSWFTGNNVRTNDNETDEILLHRSGHAYDNTIYLRTIMTSGGVNGEGLKLLIAANKDLSAAYTYTFKFKRII